MRLLSRLVDLLAEYVDDAAPVPELEIQQFAQEHNILLRDDHLKFLARFGCESGRRLRLFHCYGGNFGFDYLKNEYLDEVFETVSPPGCVYLGSNFVGDSFCVDYESGGVYLFDEEDRYGLVHEGIDGFVFSCLFLAYRDRAFSSIEVEQNLDLSFVANFRSANEGKKIRGSTRFDTDYRNIDSPKAVSEYYWVDEKVVAYYEPACLAAYGGGVLRNI